MVVDMKKTSSCVGIQWGDHVEIITNNQGHHITPSWVSYERLVGDSTKDAFYSNPTNTVFDTKRQNGQLQIKAYTSPLTLLLIISPC
ncbi:Hsp70 protein-domain-containing protein [Suillus lakei]|nr:Hsp70 protein-domain-containing protein [Suillus lakei]